MYMLYLFLSLIFYFAQYLICVAILSRAVSKSFIRERPLLVWIIISFITLFLFAAPIYVAYTERGSSDVLPGLAYIFLPVYGALILFGYAVITGLSLVVRKAILGR